MDVGTLAKTFKQSDHWSHDHLDYLVQGNKEYLEKQIKEAENNLRELVMAKKASASS